MKQIRVRLTFISEILGTQPGNQAIHSTYVASKAPDAEKMADEVAAIGAEMVTEKTMTIFPRNAAGDEIFWSYQIRGFFKSAQQTLNRIYEKKKFPNMTAFKTKIDNLVFVKAPQDRWDGRETGIIIHYPEGVEESYDCERPLRAETAQGPRVALAHSETCPEGSWIEMDILTRADDLMEYVPEWLNSGIYYGISQWRNAGKGRFVWEQLDDAGNVIGGNKCD